MNISFQKHAQCQVRKMSRLLDLRQNPLAAEYGFPCVGGLGMSGPIGGVLSLAEW